MEHVLSQDQESRWKFAPTQRGVVKVAHQYKILHNFLENFNGDKPREPFEFAGFYFNFRINLFVKAYLPHVTNNQMREVLRALGIKKTTIDDYLKGELAGDHVIDKVAQFIKDFKTFANTFAR